MTDTTEIREAMEKYKNIRQSGDAKDIYVRTLENLVEALAKYIIEKEKRTRQ